MLDLYVLIETYTNGYKTSVIDIVSICSIVCGIFVIISKNPIISVLFLIGLFFNISAYLMLIGMNFIGISYLLVYVGAVSILFIFILMLINIRVSELLSETNNTIPLAIIIVILFNYLISQVLPYSAIASNYTNIYYVLDKSFYTSYYLTDNIENDLNLATSKLWDGSLSESTHITNIGSVMYTTYSMWLISTSIILLLAMVGAIVITIRQRN